MAHLSYGRLGWFTPNAEECGPTLGVSCRVRAPKPKGQDKHLALVQQRPKTENEDDNENEHDLGGREKQQRPLAEGLRSLLTN